MNDSVSRADIETETRLLRNSEDPFWARLRRLLRERGVEPDGVLLAFHWPEDEGVEIGYLVTADKLVLRFEYWTSRPPLPEAVFEASEEGHVSRVVNRSQTGFRSEGGTGEPGHLEELRELSRSEWPSSKEIGVALEMLSGG